MPYQKSIYDNRAIADIKREAVDNIEAGLHVGYHAVTVAACVQHMEIFGDVAAFWPFFEGRLNVVQDFGPNGYHLGTTLPAVADLDAWDTPPRNQGVMRAYRFNGTDEILMAADQAAFTVVAQSVFSVGAWVYMFDSADSTILSKWDFTTDAEAREWLLCMDNTGYPTMLIYDETNNAGIGREDQTALSETVWHYIVATYHGGTDPADIKIYVDGVQTDDADAQDDVDFATMVNTATPVRCGSYEGADGSETFLFDGKMWGPFFTLKELSADEIWNLYQLGKGVLELDLIAGMPG